MSWAASCPRQPRGCEAKVSNSLGQKADTTLKCRFVPRDEKTLFHVTKITICLVALPTATVEAAINSSLHPQDSTYTHINHRGAAWNCRKLKALKIEPPPRVGFPLTHYLGDLEEVHNMLICKRIK